MAISKQHKLYAGILGVAAIGLLVDRTMLQPREAAAESGDEFRLDPSEEENAEISVELHDRNTVSTRLVTLAASRNCDPLNVRDVFAVPWQSRPAMEESVPEPTAASDAEEFTNAHRLTAVMGSGATGYAIVDGRCLRVGQSIGKWKLTGVGAGAASFDSGDAARGLTIPVNGPASANPSPALVTGSSPMSAAE